MPDTETTLSKPIYHLVDTGTARNEALARERLDQKDLREAWDRIIDSYLIEWGRNPEAFDTEEIIPPSESVIHRACILAQQMRDAGLPPPLRVVPDGDGGVSFERQTGQRFESLDLSSEGTIELVTFEDCRIVSRISLV